MNIKETTGCCLGYSWTWFQFDYITKDFYKGHHSDPKRNQPNNSVLWNQLCAARKTYKSAIKAEKGKTPSKQSVSVRLHILLKY